eukprot:195616_1
MRIYTHIIVITVVIYAVASYRSEAEKREFMQEGREQYRKNQADYTASYSVGRDDIGGEEVYAQHNAEATDGQGFETPDKLGFKILDYGVDGFEESCIYKIITNKMKIKAAIGMMNRDGRDYAVDLEVENISDEDFECIIDTGTVFEQKKYTHAQNLAIKKETTLKIPKGETIKQILNAFCIDPSYNSPDYEPMNITPFIYTAIKENDSQGRVWDEVRNLRNDVTETLKMKQKRQDL